MSFNLAQLKAELEGAPVEAPFEPELAIAVVADLLRLAGATPPPSAEWHALLAAGPNRPGQLDALARALARTSLLPASVATLIAAPLGAPLVALERFFIEIAPLTAELIGENPFRREELLRRWIEAVGGTIAGESEAESRRRLEQLDYKKTLADYQKAERGRLAEAQKRAEALKKAAEEAAEAARGWRE